MQTFPRHRHVGNAIFRDLYRHDRHSTVKPIRADFHPPLRLYYRRYLWRAVLSPGGEKVVGIDVRRGAERDNGYKRLMEMSGARARV